MTAPVRPQKMRIDQYQWAKKEGYSDDELRAQGYELPSLPSRAQQILQGRAADNDEDAVRSHLRMDDAADFGMGAASGASFGAVGGVVAKDRMRKARERNPALTGMGEVMGGVATSGPVRAGGKAILAKLPAKTPAIVGGTVKALTGNTALEALPEKGLVPRALARARNLIRGTAAGAVPAATYGALSSPDDRTGGALRAGLAGGAAGALLTAGAGAVDMVRHAKANQPEARAAQLLREGVETGEAVDDAEALIRARAANAPEGSVLADLAGPDNLANMHQAQSMGQSKARTLAIRAMQARAEGRPERLEQAVESGTGIARNYSPLKAMREDVALRQPAIDEAYAAARQAGAGGYAGPPGSPEAQLDEILKSRQPVIDAAERIAKRRMANTKTTLPREWVPGVPPGTAVGASDEVVAAARQEEVQRLRSANAEIARPETAVPLETLKPLGSKAVEREAARRASAEAQYRSAINEMARLSKTGSTTFGDIDAANVIGSTGRPMPTWEYGDLVRRQLSSDATRALKKKYDLGLYREIRMAQKELEGVLDNLNPQGERARWLEFQKRAVQQASGLGTGAHKKDPREVKQLVDDLLNPELIQRKLDRGVTTAEEVAALQSHVDRAFRGGLADGMRQAAKRGGKDWLEYMGNNAWREAYTDLAMPDKAKRAAFGAAMQREAGWVPAEQAVGAPATADFGHADAYGLAGTPWAVKQAVTGSPALFLSQAGGDVWRAISGESREQAAKRLVELLMTETGTDDFAQLLPLLTKRAAPDASQSASRALNALSTLARSRSPRSERP